MLIKNKVILVTGACGRIGTSIVEEFINNGNFLILMDQNEERLCKLSKNYSKENHLIYQGDIVNKNDLDNCIQKSFKSFGRIDAAVHAAYPKSIGWGTRFEDLKIENLSEDLKNHLGGAIIMSQRIIKFFLEQGYGQLIHISSIQGVSSPKFEHYENTNMISPIEYSAIKSGIISLVKYLAKYYKKKNIRVNCVSPGGILNNQPKNFLRKYNEECNSKGMLEGKDLNGLLAFLISDSSKLITGQNIIIDDGWSL